MRYSTEPRDRRYVKGYGFLFLSFLSGFLLKILAKYK